VNLITVFENKDIFIVLDALEIDVTNATVLDPEVKMISSVFNFIMSVVEVVLSDGEVD
jgi:hypothetical protein